MTNQRADAPRWLIVNADDFGMTSAINRGVARAHRDGIVTSASLMVRWPAAIEAASFARELPRLSVGLHVDLGEWVASGGDWRPLYEVVPISDADAVSREIKTQLGRFRELMGADPTHLDSHQHVHRTGPVLDVLLAAADDLRVPLRHYNPVVRYCGGFYGQSRGEPIHEAITARSLRALLRDLPLGVTEIGCHPADAADMASPYGLERVMELAALCDPVVTSFARDEFTLTGFREVAHLVHS